MKATEGRRLIGCLLMVALAASTTPALGQPAKESSAQMRDRLAPSQTTESLDISDRLQRRLERSRSETVAPGAQAALIRNGELVWFGTDGSAVRKPHRRVTQETILCYASFGKMLLASFALQQVQAGLLKLDEPIRTYVGSDVAGAGRVTVRMLLDHTAGYPDIYSHRKIAPLFGRQYDPDRKWTFRKLFKGLRHPKRPGETWAYSNTGYLVLAYVLREVTDEPVPDAFMDFISPAGVIQPITEKSLAMRRTKAAARLIAHGYIFDKSPPYDTFVGARSIPTDLFGMPWGDGAFSGSALAGAQFLDALLVSDLLLDAKSVEEMVTPTPQAQEQSVIYGLGTEQIEASDRTWVGHSGAYGGFSSMAYTDLESGVTLVAVANGWGIEGNLPAVPIWRDLASVYVQHEL